VPEPTATEPQLSQELANKIAAVKTPLWKKVLWWTGGILLVVLIIVFFIWLFRWKTPIAAAKEVTDYIKSELFQSDMDAKINLAKAQGAEEAAIKKLQDIRDEKNQDRAFEELAKLLKARETVTP
jgi:uncharacterized membrane protein YvbJ